MNITPITNNQTNFDGKILTEGHWMPYLKESFINNPEVQKMASGSHDIIGSLSCKTARKNTNRYYQGQKLFKLSIRAQKENPTLLDKIKSRFGLLPKVNVTKHYHSDAGIKILMEGRVNAEKYKDRLNLNV